MTPVTEATPAVKLTDRINRIEPSATMAVVAEADKLRQQGIDVVDFGAGEPHARIARCNRSSACGGFRFGLPPRRSDCFGWRKARTLQCHPGTGGSRR